MRGCELISTTLGRIKTKPRTTHDVVKATGIGYLPQMRLVGELRDSGLIVPVGHRRAPNNGHGGIAVVYGFREGEAVITGRESTRNYLRLWNALLEADSAEAIAEDCGRHSRQVRISLNIMHKHHLVRIAGWQRNRDGGPTALWMLGDTRETRDTPRPRAITEHESYLRVKQRKADRMLFDAFTWRLAA
jgi:hypothetical protein